MIVGMGYDSWDKISCCVVSGEVQGLDWTVLDSPYNRLNNWYLDQPVF